MNRHCAIAMLAGIWLTQSLIAFASPASSISTERGTISVPQGFTIERVAGPPLVGHPMMASFDERGRLFIAESAGKNLRPPELESELPNFIRMLEDLDGDGVFDHSTIFADRMTLPMGALPYRGSVYVAAPPSIWRLQDLDDDGVADRREVLVDKFGYNGNAASIHGPFLSPTGRIFWCDGRHGHEFRDEEGRVTSRKRGSGIFSMLPDGSDIRMFCGGGMDNPVEVDFLPTGEVVGSVNILLTKPRVDCLVHWQDGGVYPHQEASIAEFTRTGDLLGPMTRFGHVAVSGMCRYRSTALGRSFQNALFTTIFNTGKVIVSTVERQGGTFTTAETEFLSSTDPDFHPTDILEDADGSLLLIDTGGWFRIGCPTSQIAKPDIAGAIYRIRRSQGTKPELTRDFRGLTQDMDNMSLPNLLHFLNDDRPAVCEKAIEELSRRDELRKHVASLFEPGSGGTLTSSGQLHLVWSIARRDDSFHAEFVSALMNLVTDSSRQPDIRIAAATALVDIRRRTQQEPLPAFDLSSAFSSAENAAVRRSIARLIGVWYEDQGQSPGGSEELRKSIARNSVQRLLSRLGEDVQHRNHEPTDRPTEHAAIFAAIRIADPAGTRPLLKAPSPIVRRAALITLDQLASDQLSREDVIALLDTDDEALRNTALDVISRQDGWAGETRSLLSGWLLEANQPPGRTAMIRGFLRTQTRDPAVQQLIADLLQNGKLPPGSRLLLLEVIAESGLPTIPTVWQASLSSSLAHTDDPVRHQTVRTVSVFETDLFDQQLLKLASDTHQPVDLRIDALAAAAPRRSETKDEELAFVTSQMAEDSSPLRKLAAATTLVRLPLSESQRQQIAQSLASADPLTIGILLQEFTQDLTSELAQLVLNSLQSLPMEQRLPEAELLAFLKAAPDSVRSDIQKLVESRLQTTNEVALEKRLASLTAGDPSRGRDVFFGKTASCSSCHTIAGQGGKVGPDLTKIGAIRKRRDLLEAIMFPSASFARGYRSWTLATDRGRVHTGLITRETTDSLMLRKSDLSEIRILRDSIEEMRESTTSVMPEGLDHRLTTRNLSDLLEFLLTLK